MSPTVATFLFELINVLLLAGLLGWLLFRPVRAALQARQDAERQRRDALTAHEAEIQQQRLDLEQRLRAFEMEIADTRQQRLAAVAEEATTIRRQAHDAAERERDGARRTLAQLDRAHAERLSAAVAAVARDSVARLLATIDGPDLDVSLARAASGKLAALDGRTLGAVLVESAHLLDEPARAAVNRVLDGQAHAAEFRVVPDLGAGVRIVTAKGLIDASARGIAREAERFLAESLAVETTGAMT
jgi:F0F1-type ATP synthase membrane subunit b/b'